MNMDGGLLLALSGSGYEQVEVSCSTGSESLGSIKH